MGTEEKDMQKIAKLEAIFQETDQRFNDFISRTGYYTLGRTSTPEERDEYQSHCLLMIQQLENLSDAIKQRLEAMNLEAGQTTSPEQRESIDASILTLDNRRKKVAFEIAQIDWLMSLF